MKTYLLRKYRISSDSLQAVSDASDSCMDLWAVQGKINKHAEEGWTVKDFSVVAAEEKAEYSGEIRALENGWLKVTGKTYYAVVLFERET